MMDVSCDFTNLISLLPPALSGISIHFVTTWPTDMQREGIICIRLPCFALDLLGIHSRHGPSASAL